MLLIHRTNRLLSSPSHRFFLIRSKLILDANASGIEVIAGQARLFEALAETADAIHPGGARKFLHANAVEAVPSGFAGLVEALAETTDAIHPGRTSAFFHANTVDAVPSGLTGLVEAFAEAADTIHPRGASAFLHANTAEAVPSGFTGLVDTFAKARNAIHPGGASVFFHAESCGASVPSGLAGLRTAFSKQFVIAGRAGRRGSFAWGGQQQKAGKKNGSTEQVRQKRFHG